MRFQGLGLCCTVLAICFPALAQGDDLTLAINMANQARAAQGLQPLAWNPDLAAWARVWANEIAAGQVPFSHAEGSMRPQQGENLFEQQSTQCDIAYSTPLQTAMQSWLAQASLYTNSPVTGSEPWLHWAQLMWSTTSQVGCAWAYSISEPFKVYDVCRFFPEGNIIGQKPF